MQIPDLSQHQDEYVMLEKRLEVVNSTGDDPSSLLVTFPKASSYYGLVVCEYNELTAFCPWTRFPDQGGIRIEYVPNKLLLELKSYKYYLLAFRDRHITQEHLAEKVYDDLMVALQPASLKVILDYMPRGGIHTVFELGG